MVASSPAASFFTEAIDEVSQIVVTETGNQFQRGLPRPAIHAHVERPLASEGKTSLAFVELHRTYAYVRENAVHLLNRLAFEQHAQLTEGTVERDKAFTKG